MNLLLKKLKKQHGLTLLEVLIAITILTFLSIQIYNMLGSGIETKDRILNDSNKLLQVETALNRMDLDITGLYSPIFFSNLYKPELQAPNSETLDPAANFLASDKFPTISTRFIPVPIFENPESNSIVFFSSVNRRKIKNSKQSNFVWIKYALRTNEKEDANPDAPYELIRYYSANDPYYPRFEWDTIKPHILLNNIKSLKFFFWDSIDKKFEDSIRGLNKIDSYAPQSIKVLLTWNYSGEELEIEQIFRPLWPFFDPNNDLQVQNTAGKND